MLAKRASAGLLLAAVFITACTGEQELPDVAGEDLAFARGALASADFDYDVVDVEVDDPAQDGIVQSIDSDDDGTVTVEIGVLPTVTLTGSFMLLDTGNSVQSRTGTEEGEACSGSGGYDDFDTGMNVVIRDGSGSTIGTTSSGPATFVREDGTSNTLFCQTEFEVSVDIVDFYEIEIGRRGALSYSYDELRQEGFNLALTLG